MRLSPRPVPDWPKLAWVARWAVGADAIEVLHGPMVETAKDWCVEAGALHQDETVGPDPFLEAR